MRRKPAAAVVTAAAATAIPSLGIPDLYLAEGAVGVGNGSTGVTEFPVTNANVSTWSVSYTAALTPDATGTAEFGLSVGGSGTLSIGGRPVVSYGPGTRVDLHRAGGPHARPLNALRPHLTGARIFAPAYVAAMSAVASHKARPLHLGDGLGHSAIGLGNGRCSYAWIVRRMRPI